MDVLVQTRQPDGALAAFPAQALGYSPAASHSAKHNFLSKCSKTLLEILPRILLRYSGEFGS